MDREQIDAMLLEAGVSPQATLESRQTTYSELAADALRQIEVDIAGVASLDEALQRKAKTSALCSALGTGLAVWTVAESGHFATFATDASLNELAAALAELRRKADTIRDHLEHELQVESATPKSRTSQRREV